MTAPVYTTTASTLTNEQIQSYRQQGFIHIPGIISKEEAARFHDAALAASKRLKDIHGGSIFTQTLNVWREDEDVKALTLHPNIGAVAEKLAGVPLRIWHDHILIKQPHNNAPTEFHQDNPYWPHHNGGHSLSAWVALVDVPVERGCMTFIPGSQTVRDLRAQDLSDEHDLFKVHPDFVWEPRVTVPLKAGDCTFHSSFTAHMATPNFTDEPRVAHIIIYMDADTTFMKQGHPVTDPLHLEEGAPLDGELFPRAVR